MAETRISSDEYRIRRRLESSTHATRYKLDEPGQGTALPFQEDVFCRLQHYGANIAPSMLDLETQLRGRGDKYRLTYQDAPKKGQNDPLPTSNYMPALWCGSQMPYTGQSRAELPAFLVRNQEQPPRWEDWLDERNPQNHVEKAFQHSYGSRLGEKDAYLAKAGNFSKS